MKLDCRRSLNLEHFLLAPALTSPLILVKHADWRSARLWSPGQHASESGTYMMSSGRNGQTGHLT